MKLKILFFLEALCQTAELSGPRYDECPELSAQPKLDSKLLKRIGQVWKMNPSEVVPRDGCEPALTQMHCENYIKFSDSLFMSMDLRKKRQSRYRYSRSVDTKKRPRPISKRCSVILAETMDNESICFYDFELTDLNGQKKIDRRGFQVRCEKLEWTEDVELTKCNEECKLIIAKTCISQFESFCPTISVELNCKDCNTDSFSPAKNSSELIEVDLAGRIYKVEKDLLPMKKQDCFENEYILDKKILTVSECKYLIKEKENPQYQIPLSAGFEMSDLIKTPREKLDFCKDFMFDIWNELRQQEEKIEALENELS